MVGWNAQFFGGMELGRVLLFKKLQSPGMRVSAVLFWKSFSGSQVSIVCNDVEMANKKTRAFESFYPKVCQENGKSWKA